MNIIKGTLSVVAVCRPLSHRISWFVDITGRFADKPTRGQWSRGLVNSSKCVEKSFMGHFEGERVGRCPHCRKAAETHVNGVSVVKVFKNALCFPAKRCTRMQNFAYTISKIFRGSYPRTCAVGGTPGLTHQPPARPKAWTQTPISAGFARIAIVPVLRNDHWTVRDLMTNSPPVQCAVETRVGWWQTTTLERRVQGSSISHSNELVASQRPAIHNADFTNKTAKEYG